MGGVENWIQMDYANCWWSIIIVIWLHDPHASEVIRHICNMHKPVNKGTWKKDVIMYKWKKSKDTDDVLSLHSSNSCVAFYEYDIVSLVRVVPVSIQMNIFSPCSLDTAWIRRQIKNSSWFVININIEVEWWAHGVKEHCWRRGVRFIQMCLIEEQLVK